ncbi:MAG: hypothetical protein DHS80DRAFT_32002 [Piptocephalis tieghemiana]|nr:MAG: hypothetical protein DHS80DRAFT_32002 [Piptocephalis tieghemiana]
MVVGSRVLRRLVLPNFTRPLPGGRKGSRLAPRIIGSTFFSPSAPALLDPSAPLPPPPPVEEQDTERALFVSSDTSDGQANQEGNVYAKLLKTHPVPPLKFDPKYVASVSPDVLTSWLGNLMYSNVHYNIHSSSHHGRNLFFSHPAPNHLALNIALRLCYQNGMHPAPMVSLFEYAVKRGVKPDLIAYNQIISAYSRQKDAHGIHSWIRKAHDQGLKLDIRSWLPLVMCHSYSGDVEAAERVLSEMRSHGILPDTRLYNALLSSLADHDLIPDMERIMREMKELDVPMNSRTWGIFIRAYTKVEDLTQATWAFKESIKAGLETSYGIVYLCKLLPLRDILGLLRSVGSSSSSSSSSLPSEADSSPPRVVKEHMANALIGRAIRTNDFPLAFALFSELREKDGFIPNATTYSMIIDAYAKQSNGQGAIALLRVMQEEGLSPDIVIYNQVMTALRGGPGIWMVDELINEVHAAADAEGSIVVPNIYFYNSALKCASSFADGHAALRIMDHITSRRIATDPRTINYLFRALLVSKMPGGRVWRLWGRVKSSTVSASFKSFFYVFRSLSDDKYTPASWILQHAIEAMDRLEVGRASTLVAMAMIELCQRGKWDGESGAMSLWSESTRRRIPHKHEGTAALLERCLQEERWITAEVIWEQVEKEMRHKSKDNLSLSSEVVQLWVEILAEQGRWQAILEHLRRLDRSFWAEEDWVRRMAKVAPVSIRKSIQDLVADANPSSSTLDEKSKQKRAPTIVPRIP